MRSLDRKLKAAFIISAVSLSLIGLVFVHSAGSYWGQVHYADSSPFIVKQGIYMAVSIFVALLLMKGPWTSNQSFWTAFYYITILYVGCCYDTRHRCSRNGSQSWIALGPFSIQPAEFVKVALIGKLACSMKHSAGKSPFKLSHFVLILLPAALIMLQPDLGSAVIMIVSAFVILFLSGYPLSFFGILGFAGIGAFVALIAAAPYRLAAYKIIY